MLIQLSGWIRPKNVTWHLPLYRERHCNNNSVSLWLINCEWHYWPCNGEGHWRILTVSGIDLVMLRDIDLVMLRGIDLIIGIDLITVSGRRVIDEWHWRNSGGWQGSSLLYVSSFCRELLGQAVSLEACRADLQHNCNIGNNCYKISSNISISHLLKGLSHEIDFKNFDKNTELGLTKRRGWFLNFLGAPMIFKCKKCIYLG